MLLYKYRDLTDPGDGSLVRLSQLLSQVAFWAARPDSLNDPEELLWECSYDSTPRTEQLLADVLVITRALSENKATAIARQAVANNRVQYLADPVLDLLKDRLRSQIGLVCFGTSPDNPCLWQRYGGGGNGVCVEIDVADFLLGTQLRIVKYAAAKSLHIDDLLDATLNNDGVSKVFELTLLTKPLAWVAEQEIRFISKKQAVTVRLYESRITSLILGNELSSTSRHAIDGIVSRLPYELPVREHNDS